MADNQQTESGVQRVLRIGNVTLTLLGPVINPLASQLADRLARTGKQPAGFEVLDVEDVEDKPNVKKVVFVDGEEEEVVVTKQSVGDILHERGEALLQELEELVERGSKLSQSLGSRSSEVTHDLVERGNSISQDLLKRSKEVQQELRKRGKKLNKNLNKRSQKVSKELNKRSQKVSKELSKRSRQATRQISERNNTFWILSGFAVGLAAAGITAYLLIRQRMQQQQQLEAEQSIPLLQNDELNMNISSAQIIEDSTSTTPEAIIQQLAQPSLAEENAPAVAVADLENRRPAAQSAPSNAAFIGVVGTHHYYPISTPLDQLANSETGKNDVVYFTTEEEARTQGYSSSL